MDLATNDVRELRRDVNNLTLTLTQLRSDFTHEKETTTIVLDNFEKDGKHLKESIDSRFDVLLTRLDSKLAAFENHIRATSSEKKSSRLLESGSND